MDEERGTFHEKLNDAVDHQVVLIARADVGQLDQRVENTRRHLRVAVRS